MLRCALALLVASAAACGDNAGTADLDASQTDAAVPVDADSERDGDIPLAWVDFAITGCESGLDVGDAGVPSPCTGTAPLALSFTAISPAPIEIYRWTFGDASAQSTSAAPTYTYREPGTYSVALAVGGPGGTATEDKAGIVVVQAAEMAAPCSTDPQCGAGLECVCADVDDCGDVLVNGMCAADCGAASCTEGVCADLGPAATGSADWQRELCLVACTDSTDCPSGLTCQDLLAQGGASWVRGCFAPNALGVIGASCVGPDSQPNDEACASGTCLALGARGACTTACAAGECPAGSACATFQDAGIGSVCLDRCASASECQGDPWLTCEAPGGTGDKSFTVDETAAPNGYCAPRSCTDMPDECGPDGACVDGFCAAAP